jgi:hypothetical protein
MPNHRKRLGWIYDDVRQEFSTPSGRVVSLHEIAQLLHDQIVAHHDLQGPWAGWRIRGCRIVPPCRSFRNAGIAPHQLAAFERWLRTSPADQQMTANELWKAPTGAPESNQAQGTCAEL